MSTSGEYIRCSPSAHYHTRLFHILSSYVLTNQTFAMRPEIDHPDLTEVKGLPIGFLQIIDLAQEEEY
ncbi:MAG: hypothetical protein P8O70_08650 [SAR324 cluster bacterium]|nr:hypothetical protein [SAR324 cluster bacterium]